MTAEDRQRLDKWLWQARFAKTRSLAARWVSEGRVRVNRLKVLKPAHDIKPGDVLTLSMGASVRVIAVSAIAHRRGPASEARALYEDLTAPRPEN